VHLLIEFCRFKWLHRLLRWSNLFLAGWWVASIEKTLQYNHVKGVGFRALESTGQLLPLCIGALGVLKVLIDRITAASAVKRAVQHERPSFCPQCRWREKPCSRSVTASTPGGQDFVVKRHGVRGFVKGLLAAWLPWLTAFLYPRVTDDDSTGSDTTGSYTTGSSTSSRS
jgi:hypothetical protein